MTNALQDNVPLLDKMMADMNSQEHIYKPSPFWFESATQTAKALKRYGLNNFRYSWKATPGATWTDAPRLSVYDYIYGFKKTLKGKLARFIFGNDIFRRRFLDSLDDAIRSGAENTYFKWYKFYRDYWLNSQYSDWFSEVLRNHTIPDNTLGGCTDVISICDQIVTPAYFGTLARTYNFYDHTDFRKIKTLFVIGGGFGYEVHLTMSLFPNIKKCLTLDIPPILYAQTQYLKAVMNDRVIDYAETCEMDKIAFSGGQETEIIAIAPWQIENVDASIDLLWNSCSFQEMTLAQVKNYARFSQNLMARSAAPEICLTMYNREATTLRAEVLDAFEGFRFEQIQSSRKHTPPPYDEFHYIGRKLNTCAPKTGPEGM